MIYDFDSIEKNSPLILFKNNDLLVLNDDNGRAFPTAGMFTAGEFAALRFHSAGEYSGLNCYGADLPEETRVSLPHKFLSMRGAISSFDSERFLAAAKANQIVMWDRNTQYCGRCGSPTVADETERVKRCPKCSLDFYPRISPAVIVLITRGDEMLLGQNKRFVNQKMYSCIAGFMEPCETFEECLAREVKEEINIKIKNIKYFASQPWPFPDSLMVGFTAEYDSGEIIPDGSEIVDARWFKAGSLPDELPNHYSIARKLINSEQARILAEKKK